MAKILLIGVGPLPFCNVRWPLGPGQRTWQFARPLLADGHEILLVTLEFGAREGVPKDQYEVDPRTFGNVELFALPEPDLLQLGPTLAALESRIKQFAPDAAVSAGNLMSGAVAARHPLDVPLWIDIDGSVPAELQALWVNKPDLPVEALFAHYRAMLQRGDRFSAVSEPQRLSVIGELALLGRLNPATYGYELTHRLPIAVEDDAAFTHDKTVLRGIKVTDEDFVVLWSGGFNTWADVDLLHAGLERAMKASPRIQFVSTGGGIRGHHEAGYQRFEQLISTSSNRNRYHLMGWVPTEDVANYYFEADIGINVDLDVAESLLGSRKRLLAFMSAGLPCVTTVTCELSQLMSRRDVCYGVETGDPDAIAKAILAALNFPDERRRRGRDAREYVLSEFNFTRTTAPLVQWCRAPKAAPDRGKYGPLWREGTGSAEESAGRKSRFGWLFGGA